MSPDDPQIVAPVAPSVSSTEVVYRRCVPGWFSPKASMPSIRDFMPRAWQSSEAPGDKDGLSVTRPAVEGKLPNQAAMTSTGKLYHVAELVVAFIQSVELSVEARPTAEDRSHAVVPELNSLDRRDPAKEAWMEERAKLLRDSAKMVFIANDGVSR